MGGKGRKKIDKDFKFELQNYIYFLKLALTHPKKYTDLTTRFKKTKTAFFFLIINISIGLSVVILEKIILNRNLNLAFPAISETLFWIPFGVIILTIFAFILHVGARISGGRGSLKESINVACYSSIPLIVFAVPYLFIPALFWAAILLIISFKSIHLYPAQRAVVNITFPFLIIVLGMIMLGVLNPAGLYYKLTTLATLVKADY